MPLRRLIHPGRVGDVDAAKALCAQFKIRELYCVPTI